MLFSNKSNRQGHPYLFISFIYITSSFIFVSASLGNPEFENINFGIDSSYYNTYNQDKKPFTVFEKLANQFTLNKLVIVSTLATISLIALSNHLLVTEDRKEEEEEGVTSKLRSKLSQLSSSIMDGINYSRQRITNSTFSQPGLNLKDPEYKKSYNVAVKTGLIGGLVNDGNTCFMNSVLQSLASSNEFTEFLDEYTSLKDTTALSDDLKFSKSLKLLLTKINGKHFNRSGYYKTRPLMRSLPQGPNRNLITGYDQEDAQEFYQMVLKELEKEYIKTLPEYSPEPLKRESSPSNLFTDRTDEMIYGLDQLGATGEVYVPLAQIDPNFPNPENKVYPLKLVTPVDGLSAERIGCTLCGEIGGIRYSVISGLSLNLQATNKNSYSLEELLSDWIQPEIIDDVECNRCGLVQMCKILEQQISNSGNEKIAQLMAKRLDEIKFELSKPIISDEAYKKLHTKNHIQKSQKIKQIFYSRPPALLTIHINRSVFDPRTYMIRKNGAQVQFPMKLDLTPFVAECDDINMDARLCFRKQDEELKQQQPLEVEEEISHIMPSLSVEDDLESEEEEETIRARPKYDSLGNDIIYSDASSEEEGEEEDYISPNPNHSRFPHHQQQQPSPPQSVEDEVIVETEVGPLTYSLKSVISHFGTHNYGHYIAFRKYRGIWWRVSDETVRITTEREVLSTSGVFMLFYELSLRNDEKDVIPEIDDDEEEQVVEEEEEEEEEEESSSANEKESEEEDYEIVDNADSADSEEEEKEI